MTAVYSDQGGACCLLVDLKNISFTVLCLTKKLFLFLFFIFVIDRKQLKIAVCRIDSAMQRRGSLNQQPLRFVVDTLKLDDR